MPEDRPKVRFGASTVVVGAEDVLGRRLMHLDLAIEPFCSSLEPPGHRYTCGLIFSGGTTGGWGKGSNCVGP